MSTYFHQNHDCSLEVFLLLRPNQTFTMLTRHLLVLPWRNKTATADFVDPSADDNQETGEAGQGGRTGAGWVAVRLGDVQVYRKQGGRWMSDQVAHKGWNTARLMNGRCVGEERWGADRQQVYRWSRIWSQQGSHVHTTHTERQMERETQGNIGYGMNLYRMIVFLCQSDMQG